MATHAPATLMLGEDLTLAGTFTDLSSLGCHFAANLEANTVLPPLEIDSIIQFRCVLPNVSLGEIEVKGRIRNIQASSKDLEMGVLFSDLPIAISTSIEEYIRRRKKEKREIVV